jgi:hypothetical protein
MPKMVLVLCVNCKSLVVHVSITHNNVYMLVFGSQNNMLYVNKRVLLYFIVK